LFLLAASPYQSPYRKCKSEMWVKSLFLSLKSPRNTKVSVCTVYKQIQMRFSVHLSLQSSMVGPHYVQLSNKSVSRLGTDNKQINVNIVIPHLKFYHQEVYKYTSYSQSSSPSSPSSACSRSRKRSSSSYSLNGLSSFSLCIMDFL